MTTLWSASGVVDAEISARMKELSEQGLSHRAIAAELGVSVRTLQRLRAVLRQPADAPSPAAKRVRGRGDRTMWLQVRISEEERTELKRLARLAGVSVGEYVRCRALDVPLTRTRQQEEVVGHEEESG